MIAVTIPDSGISSVRVEVLAAFMSENLGGPSQNLGGPSQTLGVLAAPIVRTAV